MGALYGVPDANGREQQGLVHVEAVFDHNEEPAYMRATLLHRRNTQSRLSKREIVRRLRTSPSQFHRLLDPANSRKSVDRMLALLHALGYEVDFVVRPRAAA